MATSDRGRAGSELSPVFAYELGQAFGAGMLERGKGALIHIASIDGVSANPMETYSYQASKAGLIHLTRRMALQLAPERIDLGLAMLQLRGISR